MSGMSNEYAAALLEHVLRSIKDLTPEEAQAAELGVRALRAQHEPLPEAAEGFTWVEGVQMTPPLAALVRRYFGCPRGPMGLNGMTVPKTSVAVVREYLSDAKPYVLRGQDEPFVCVPKMWYDHCLGILADLEERQARMMRALEEKQ